MIYSEPLTNQFIHFINAVIFGTQLSLVYIVVKIIFRILSKSDKAVAISDSVFVVSVSILSFFYMVTENGGMVRFNLIAAQFIGGISIYFLIGRFLLKIFYPLCDILNYIIFFPLRIVVKVIRIAYSFIKNKIKVTSRLKSSKKSVFKRKKSNYCKNTLEISE